MKSYVFLPAICLGLMLLATPAHAGPSIVATAEGQIGVTPGADDAVFGARFESIRGQEGDVIFGGASVFGGAMPPPPQFGFLTDVFHEVPNPLLVDSTPNDFAIVSEWLPGSARSRNASDDGDFVAFSFAVDGSAPDTMTVRVATFDETGAINVNLPIAQDVVTFFDPTSQRTDVAVDNQGRVTVIYSEVQTVPSPAVSVRAVRVNASTGTIIDPDFLVSASGITGTAALLDPSGNRLIIAYSKGVVVGRVIDFSGGSPAVLPEFPISTTVGQFNALPAVAGDPSTGRYTTVWENYEDLPGDPVNVRARRFDADGNPIGDDFIVNTTTADAQGQPDVAYGPSGNSAIVWAGDGGGVENLDVFMQVYDVDGNPIGGQMTVNTNTGGIQDLPAVRFLPESDDQGRPQIGVVWRDVETSDGTQPNGTGTSYKCFSIDGLTQQDIEIFEDGFESGDTSSWSSTTQP